MNTPATTLRRLAVLRTVRLNGIPTPEALDADAQLAGLAPELAARVLEAQSEIAFVRGERSAVEEHARRMEVRAAKAEAALAATEALLRAFAKAVPACEKCQKQPATRQYRNVSGVTMICDDDGCLPGESHRRYNPVHDTRYGAELRAALAARRGA